MTGTDDTYIEDLPRIGITMGDAAGIGSEIVLKSIASDEITAKCRPIIVGDLRFLQALSERLGLKLSLTADGTPGDGSIPVHDLGNLRDGFPIGKDSAVTGRASAEYITAAVDLWRSGVIDAIATAPISKKAIAMGGYDFPGHTEFLADLTETKKFAMSFFAGELRVVLLSTHVPLSDAIGLVKSGPLAALIRFTYEQLSGLLGRPVSIAVAGLNPHASEHGLFGSEEANEIIPAIEIARADGIIVSGPYSPDTIFLRAHRGEFDAVIACYHDQATIAVKCLSFGHGVNVTLGLPLIRTSVDHGTAYDIAGKGVADASSMSAAVNLAAELVSIRTRLR